jgi:EpsI family protein
MARVLILCACLLGGSGYIAWTRKSGTIPPRDGLATLPFQIGTWQGQQEPQLSGQIMAVLGVDDYASRSYFGPRGAGIGLYVGYYLSQRQGSSIHSPLNCLPGAGWNPVKREYMLIRVGASSIQANRIVILKGLEKLVVLYWYQAHGRTVASEYSAKSYAVLDAIRTGRTDGALVRIISPAESLEPAAEEVANRHAVDFAQALYPLLNRYVPD